MPTLRHPRLLVLAVATAAVLPVLVAPPATAEEPPTPVAPATPAEPGAPAPGDTIVGELVQGYADPFPSAASAPVEHALEAPHETGDGHADGLISWIRTDVGEAIRVPTEDVEGIATGSTVEVTVGEAIEDEVAAADLAPAQEVLDSQVLAAPAEDTASAAGTVNHPVTVVMLQPSGSTRDGGTLAEVRAAIDGPVADFWEQQTDGAVRLGTVAGSDWTTESTLSCEDPFALWEEAATRAGWAGGAGQHLLVYVPAGSPGCSYGLGTIGSGAGSGGLSYVQATELSVLAHEIGHNLGLGHSSLVQCDGVVDSGSCQVSSYFDLYDVMGVSWGPVGSLNAPHAALLGALPTGAAPTLAAGAATMQYTLAPVGSRTGTRAVRLVDRDGWVFWLEYRTATGQDSWLGTADNTAGVQSGVLLRAEADAFGDTSWLLDGTPSGPDDWAADLAFAVPGNTPVSFGTAPFTVTVLEAGPSGARVSVSARTPVHPIDAAYERLGGRAVLGDPTGGRICGLAGDGCRRSYAGGDIYWSPKTGAHVVRGAILERWRSLGAHTGRLGYPVGDDVAVPGGFKTDFAGGSIYWSQATGARAVRGAILRRYVAAGGPKVLGFPVADEGRTADGTGALVRLQRGVIYWSPSTGAHVVRGAILERWRSLGAHTGVLGYPTGDDVAVPGGFKTDFAGGSIYWSQATGARMVRGAILQRYVSHGGPKVLGFPVADDGGTADRTGALVRLQGGVIYWSPRTGAHVVRGAILQRWQSLGAQTGVLGYPTGDDVAVPGGYRTDFAGGSIYWSAATGARMVRGAILQRYVAAGGPGALGFPVADDGGTADRTGALVRLQKGAIYWSSTTGAHVVRGAILTRWRELGAQAGKLGYPVTDPIRLADGTGVESRFQRGSITQRTDGRIEVRTR